MLIFNKKTVVIYLGIFILSLLFFFILPQTAESAITKSKVDDEIPSQFIPIYQSAAKKYGVDWRLLASVHNQETSFSSNVTISSAGAVGHTQFMKCTWIGWSASGCSGTKGNSKNVSDAQLMNLETIAKHGGYGVDGNQDGKANPYDIVDAIYSMANYLGSAIAKNPTASDRDKVYKAARTYNHSDTYATEVTNRWERYKKESTAQSPEDTVQLTGVEQDGMYLVGVSSDQTAVIQGDVQKAVSELGISATNTGSSSSSSSLLGGNNTGSSKPNFFIKNEAYKSAIGENNKANETPNSLGYSARVFSAWFYDFLMKLGVTLSAILVVYVSFTIMLYAVVIKGYAEAEIFEKLAKTKGSAYDRETVISLIIRSIAVVIVLGFALSGIFVEVMAFIYFYFLEILRFFGF